MKTRKSLPQGTNLRLLLEECECEKSFLYEHSSTKRAIADAIESVGFQYLADTGHSFQEGGYTSVFILAESHVVVHTWPEHNHTVIIDVSVCDFRRPNRDRTLDLGRRISEIFRPQKTVQEVLPMIPRLSDQVLPGQGYYVEIEELRAIRSSAHQDILIVGTKPFGRALLIDGIFQTSEKDGFFYHEPLVHTPMLSHENPVNVLICGGGDGGAAWEVLKHPSVESCTIVEIDREVADLCKKELPGVHRHAFDDPRTNLCIGDAYDFVKHCEAEFDVIVLDATDPGGISQPLFTRDFYQAAHSILAKDGCMSLHAGAPLQPNEARDAAVEAIQQVFSNVYPYLNFVPCYGTLLSYFVCFKGEGDIASPEEMVRRMVQRGISDLQCLNQETYAALFAIPPCLEAALPASRRGALSR
ncbi:MAG: polyamine aminopropyltransferase [Candidatus Omnitrophica bacterium]|nr:polyamine aminopropyltransferase [Candidatus Omnitrophota bacterium]